MSTLIKIPILPFLFFYSQKKEAVINFEKNEITTKINEENFTQPFYHVGKYELFTFLKYSIIPLLFLTSDLSISVKNEIGLFVASLLVFLYHHYRSYTPTKVVLEEDDSIVNRLKKIWHLYKVAIASVGIFFVVFLSGLTFGTLWYSRGVVEMTLYGIAFYEIAFGVVGQEWKQYRKVYVAGVPSFFPKYFKLPDSDESKKHDHLTKNKIGQKLILVLGSIMAIATIGLVYHGAISYKEYRAEQAALLQYKDKSHFDELKIQSEQNGSAQIIIKYEQIKFDEKTENLRAKLNMKPEYKELKQITYPWEKGYQRGGTLIYNADGSVASYNGGQK